MNAVIGMSLRGRVAMLAIGLMVGVVVLSLVRSRRLKEEFSLLWLTAAVLLVLAPLASDLFDRLAAVVGIDYSPNLVFALAFVVVLLLLLQFSVALSRFSEQIKALTQMVALLTRRVEELERGGAHHEGHEGREEL